MQSIRMLDAPKLDYATLGSLVDDLAERRISSVELVQHSIARIERFDGVLNAVVVRDFDRARAAAAEADAALARGERRPLLGVPMTVKESYNVAGLPTTWGMPWFKDWHATEDAVAVARLKAAGAIVIGKTNVPFALGDWQSFNDIYGTTHNPWGHGRTPGGSSGGSAVSLAAGYVPLEMGSDIGGSLRAPAHYCGVFSHKPTRGVIPSRGHAVPGTTGGMPDLSVVGPLARSASDLVRAFDVVAGLDAAEATGMRLALPAPRHARLREYRVLVIDSHPILPADSDVRGALGRLADRLRAVGTYVATSCDALPDFEKLARDFIMLLMPVIFARQPAERVAEMAARAAALSPDDDSLDAWRLRGAVATHGQWLAADARRFQAARAFRDVFESFDVVLFPPMPTAAFPQDENANDGTIHIDGTPYPYLDQLLYASLATPTWQPTTTVPVERTAAGLPVGAQIIGPYLEDRTTLHFAELLEAEFGGFVAPPGY
jgi:amidase